MIKSYPYLQDIDFLNKIYGQHNKSIYTVITSLDWQERCLQRIEGRVINGSISINGDSIVRRTANLTVKILNYEELYTNIESLVSINKKIYLEIGIKNNLAHRGYYPQYPIIYFPFGVYIIQNESVQYSGTDMTLSLSLGDKMCMLNGTSGGHLPAAINFESIDKLGPDGDLSTEYVKINQLIQEMVNHFGNEDLNNIIINDVPDKIKQVLKWKGSNPLYLLTDFYNPRNAKYTTVDNVPTGYNRRTIINNYDCGYTYVDFVYPEELVASPGDTVCTILDKIKEKLGNYEYYYDVFGRFIFQEIKNYLNTSQWRTIDSSGVQQNDLLADSTKYLSYGYSSRLNSSVYDFKDSEFIISYNNTPKFDMVKNEFIVWGERTNANNIKLPCRYHLVIDERPKLLEPLTITDNIGICFDTNLDDKIRRCIPITGVYNSIQELKNNCSPGIIGLYYRVNNEIYTWINDIENYELMLNNYITSAEGLGSGSSDEYSIKNTNEGNSGFIRMPLATAYYGTQENAFILPIDTDWRNIIYFQGVLESRSGYNTNPYWAEMCNEWPKIYDVEHNQWIDGALDVPTGLDWWLDFIDNDAILNKFSVSNIGRRGYVKTDTSCNCVFEPDIPDILIIDVDDITGKDPLTDLTTEQIEELGLTPVQVSDAIYNSMVTGGTFNSCYQHVRQILTEYTDYNENINVTALPIYHLEPNTRVSFNSPEAGISGDFLINSISFDLGNGGTMSINATKCIEKI